MRYLQVLLRARGYQLCWLPERYAEKGKQLKMRGVIWEVREVYDEPDEVIKESNKVIWTAKSPTLEGERLEERKRLYKRLNQEIEEIKGDY